MREGSFQEDMAMSQTNQQPVLLAVSAPPFWHCGRTVKKASYAMLLALAPAAFMAVWHWGIPAARVMALAMVTGIATEALCQKIMGQDISVDDFSGAVSCLLFAFLLPANAPWWLVMLGAALAIGLGKMAFGGLGANAVNTALVGWAMLYVSWPCLLYTSSFRPAKARPPGKRSSGSAYPRSAGRRKPASAGTVCLLYTSFLACLKDLLEHPLAIVL